MKAATVFFLALASGLGAELPGAPDADSSAPNRIGGVPGKPAHSEVGLDRFGQSRRRFDQSDRGFSPAWSDRPADRSRGARRQSPGKSGYGPAPGSSRNAGVVGLAVQWRQFRDRELTRR